MRSDQEKAIAKEHPRTVSLPHGYVEIVKQLVAQIPWGHNLLMGSGVGKCIGSE